MRYTTQLKSTPVPVDVVECKEGIIHVTTFDELIPFTLRALLQGYGCSSDMLNRLEHQSSILSFQAAPIDIFITYNPHTFAACSTNINKTLHLGNNHEYLEQNEILDLVESFVGSFERAGTYVNIKRIVTDVGFFKHPILQYEPPIFDTALRYLTFCKHSYALGQLKKERYMLVLYIPA